MSKLCIYHKIAKQILFISSFRLVTKQIEGISNKASIFYALKRQRQIRSEANMLLLMITANRTVQPLEDP